MEQLLKEIAQCQVCAAHLPLGPKPTITASSKSKIVLVGQAPGLSVHQSGTPWDDKSGDNLRNWLQVEKATFYDPDQIALIPMGFCYPGRGKSGDLPPRKECAPLWHSKLLNQMPEVRLMVLIGQYAQNHYLGKQTKRTLTETVQNFNHYLPRFFVLPHPSPRNNIWQAKNPWFVQSVLPELRNRVHEALASH
ncbi:uracil-DNA glycosylase family protein [Sunxiuqinia elliptica]|uniref:Uracil-DNA glycosylase family 4 n=2 Tax=Sunxiuqinia elliptica TaxID=655355 RepID=A0A4V3BZ95_9BACT|nr:uracil-DNA glycosylase family protein [Sunxiuqinia elliptica]TDO05659.1 uracil-DNA glycosylase family 4 [Sunxiuqinia elliptica]TDO65201.1 uracil-DNA glycosylase family 4 [Sunxiuqinia elliptica]